MTSTRVTLCVTVSLTDAWFIFEIFLGFINTPSPIGSMTSVRSALDLVGKVIVGRLSDTMGRFPALNLGVLASMMGTTLFGTMDSLNGLWLAMLPGG